MNPGSSAPMRLFIGNKNYSSWSMRPWVLMRNKQIDFDEVLVRFDSFDAHSTFKRSLEGVSPTGKVPVLEVRIDGAPIIIWDTLAIAEHLAERFPERTLWPVERAGRARARAFSAEMHAGFAALRSRFPLNIEARLPAIGAEAMSQEPQVIADVRRVEQIWRECLDESGGPFLFGPFGIVDAFYAPVVMRFHTYGVELDPVAAAYAACVREAPGVADWIEQALAEHDFRPFEEPYRDRPG